MVISYYPRVMTGAAVAAAFVLTVAWMVPPTEPRPGAPNWRTHITPTAPPAPVDFAGYAPATASASMPAYPVARVAVYRGQSSEVASPRIADGPAARDDADITPASSYAPIVRDDAFDPQDDEPLAIRQPATADGDRPDEE